MASLGADLAAIRKNSGLSVDDIQQKTKLTENIITSIEDDSIFDQLDRNKTYVRSYVRNYAKSLGIDDASILKALDCVELDKYEGQLKNVLDEKNKPQASDDKKADDESDSDDSSSAKKKKVPEKRDTKKEVDKQEDIDWSKYSHQSIPDGRHLKKSGKVWLSLLVILLAAAVFLYFFFNNNPKAPENEVPASINQPQLPADSLQEALLPKNDTIGVVQTTLALPDTLTISVIATNGKLEPVRVYTDLMGIRRPYWVELHDTLRFEFIDTFRVRATDQFGRMQLAFNGHIIKNAYDRFYSAESSMIELSRSLIKDHPEWMVPAISNEIL